MLENATTDYWGTIRQLATALNAPGPMPRTLQEVLNRQQETVAEAATELGGSIETYPDGRSFARLPVAPSAYGMTWLFARPEARLHWPESLAVLFNFTGTYPGSRHRESLQHWSEQVAEPWLLMVEGPVDRNAMSYELKADQAHEWADSIHAGHRMIEEFAKGRHQVGYYFNCLLPLAFEIGVSSTMVSRRRRVYHYNNRPASGPARYELAFDGWK